MSSSCRLCGGAAPPHPSRDSAEVRSLALKYVGVRIDGENEALPQDVCHACCECILTFDAFVRRCLRVQSELLGVKTELDDDGDASAFDSTSVEVIKHEYFEEEEEEDNDDAGDYNDDDPLDRNFEADVSDGAFRTRDGRRRKQKSLMELKRESDCNLRNYVTFECHLCSEVVENWYQLKIHTTSVHGETAKVVCTCGHELKSKTAIYRHVQGHTDQTVHACDQCPRVTKTAEALENHKRRHRKKHEDNDDDEDDSLDYDYEAASRDRRRKSLKELKRKSDVNLKSFVTFACHVCNEDLENWYKLKNHTASVHRETARVKCTCGCELRSKTAMYRHVQGHNDPTVYACDQCPRVTKTPKALEKHKRRHVPKPERVFSCASCPKQFNSRENLKSHERVHIPLAERYVYPCNVCGNRFTTKSAVAGHIRAVHDKIKRFICDICGYSCSTSGELVQHRAIHSDDKLFECHICQKRFKTCSNLKTHVDIHGQTSYPCGVCGKVLNSRRTLRKHFLVHEDVCKHVCHFCNKAFKRRQTLKVHLTTHTGDKPLQCPWCPVKFAFSSVLRTHKQKVHFDKMAEIKEEQHRGDMVEQHQGNMVEQHRGDIVEQHRGGIVEQHGNIKME